MVVHCTTEKQTNLLLKRGWRLKEVSNSTPTGYGFVYVLAKN